MHHYIERMTAPVAYWILFVGYFSAWFVVLSRAIRRRRSSRRFSGVELRRISLVAPRGRADHPH
jgi:hypothetical protein